MSLTEPAPVDPAEPRFAGSLHAAYAGPVQAPEDFRRTPEGFPGEPVGATDGDGDHPIVVDERELAEGLDGQVTTGPAWATRGAAVIAIVGGALAATGCFLTWATLHITALDSAATGVNDSNPDVSYQGLTLLEGRATLAFGVLAIALAVLLALGRFRERPLPTAIGVLGGLELLVGGFTAIAHPAELATLFRSYQTVGAIKVALPNGPGVWLAIGGGALILIGGLLAQASVRRGGFKEDQLESYDIDGCDIDGYDIEGYDIEGYA